MGQFMHEFFFQPNADGKYNQLSRDVKSTYTEGAGLTAVLEYVGFWYPQVILEPILAYILSDNCTRPRKG